MNKLIKITLIATALSTPIAAYANWSIVELSSFGDFTSLPNAINDSGQIVGTATTFDGNESHAFITGPNGVGVTDLFTTSKIEGAFNINNAGQVVGFSRVAGGDTHAIMTGPNGIGVTDLGSFGGSNSSALAINDSGQVLAQFKTSIGERHTVITGPNGIGFTDLGTLGGRDNQGKGINGSGQVSGTSNISGNLGAHAYLTGSNGVGLTDIGSFISSGVNDSGQVIGYAGVADGKNHAIVTGANGATTNMIDLGTLGGQFSQSIAINNLGEVVGIAETASDIGWHSFIYSHGGITDLTLLAPVVAAGWTNLIVTDINNNGQIVGDGMHNGEHVGFLLSYTPDTIFNPNPIFIPPIPVPEPETYAMLLAGLGLIGFMACRRKLYNV